MRVIYLAGPFRGPDHFVIHQNICRAEALALEVWRMGAACLCPHLNTAHFQNAAPDHVWPDGDRELLLRCDGVLLTPDWEKSAGARSEKDTAEQHNIPVFWTLDELKDWLQSS